jgi:hypothetical protein
VTYPPNPAESHWTTINQIAAQTPNVVADGPELYHGDTEAKPRPDPRASNISAAAAIAKAPAMIAGHDTAETALSTIFFRPATTVSLTVCIVVSTDWVSAIAAAEG